MQASTVAAGVSAYLIKSDMSKLGPAEMAQYFEERLGWAVTTAWNLTVKDVEQTISGVCTQVNLHLTVMSIPGSYFSTVCTAGELNCVVTSLYCGLTAWPTSFTHQLADAAVLQGFFGNSCKKDGTRRWLKMHTQVSHIHAQQECPLDLM